jgi:hypothetical protein
MRPRKTWKSGPNDSPGEQGTILLPDGIYGHDVPLEQALAARRARSIVPAAPSPAPPWELA